MSLRRQGADLKKAEWRQGQGRVAVVGQRESGEGGRWPQVRQEGRVRTGGRGGEQERRRERREGGESACCSTASQRSSVAPLGSPSFLRRLHAAFGSSQFLHVESKMPFRL